MWKEESSLHDGGWVERAVERLRASGHVYEADGATWFRSTDFGDDKDRVIYRSNGLPTYFASDIGYVTEKFSRGFDELIYIWGADHHGTVARVRNAAEAMGYDREAVRMLLIAWVRFVRDGVEIPMSKRSGEFITLDEVLDEVGVDAARWFFSSRAYTTGIDFDLELAKKQSNENPVYYVQYAHARASSILRNGADAGLATDASRTGELLRHPAEQALVRHLLDFPDALAIAAERRETHEVPRYAYELASAFSAFYRDCKVLTEDEALSAARLALVDATRCVLVNALDLLGISAPGVDVAARQFAASTVWSQQLLGRGVGHQDLAVRQLGDRGREVEAVDHGLVGGDEFRGVRRRVPRQPPGDGKRIVRPASPPRRGRRPSPRRLRGLRTAVTPKYSSIMPMVAWPIGVESTSSQPSPSDGRQVRYLDLVRRLARLPLVEVHDLLGRVRRIAEGGVDLGEVGAGRIPAGQRGGPVQPGVVRKLRAGPPSRMGCPSCPAARRSRSTRGSPPGSGSGASRQASSAWRRPRSSRGAQGLDRPPRAHRCRAHPGRRPRPGARGCTRGRR